MKVYKVVQRIARYPVQQWGGECLHCHADYTQDTMKMVMKDPVRYYSHLRKKKPKRKERLLRYEFEWDEKAGKMNRTEVWG